MKRSTLIPIIIVASLASCAELNGEMLDLTIPTASSNSPKVSILGDSYSTFKGYQHPAESAWWYSEECNPEATDVCSVTEMWWYHILCDNGWRLDTNNSWSGATICNTGYDGADFTHKSFVTRLTDIGDPDMIFIFGATNDSWAGVPVGDYVYNDWIPKDLYNFRPAMAYMISELHQRHPEAQTYVIVNDILSDSIVESMSEVCSHYGVTPVMLHDVDKKSGHPTVLGMRQIADQVESVLEAAAH